MLYLDYLAHHNALKHVSVTEKCLLGGGGLILALWLSQPLSLLLIILVMHMVMLYAKTPSGYLVRLWLGPLAFLLVSLATALVSVSTVPFTAAYIVDIGPYYIGITSSRLAMGQILLIKNLAAVSCLFMVATTTPVSYLAGYMARFAVLRLVMEITLLAYRFIFVFLAMAGQIYTAQQSRLGYANTRQTLNSLGMLVANLGRKTFITARDLYTALLARNYQGQLVMRQPQQRVSAKRLLAILIVLIGLAMTAML